MEEKTNEENNIFAARCRTVFGRDFRLFEQKDAPKTERESVVLAETSEWWGNDTTLLDGSSFCQALVAEPVGDHRRGRQYASVHRKCGIR